MLQLAPLCGNEDLKDAKFIDELGILLRKEKTSTTRTPEVTI